LYFSSLKITSQPCSDAETKTLKHPKQPFIIHGAAFCRTMIQIEKLISSPLFIALPT